MFYPNPHHHPTPPVVYSTDRFKAVAMLLLKNSLSSLTLHFFLPPVVCSTDRSKAVVPVLVLLFVALWFILRGDLFYVLHCVILFLCFSVILALRLSCLGKRELILVLFVRLFDLRLFVSSSSWCLGRAAVCDCGTPWTFLLSFFSPH